MNLFRFLTYLLLAAIVVLIASLASMIAALTGGAPLTPEARRGLIVLVLVLLLALLILLFLLCLARAKERLQREKGTYRDAHGDDPRMRMEAEAALSRGGAASIGLCDILVRRKFPRPCVQLPVQVTRRPDPCIYSQFYLMAHGQPVTWDNPNVEILLNGVPQDTYNLASDTGYRVRVGIENASPFFDAVNTQVEVNLLSFGVGAPGPAPIASFSVDVPAATAFPGIQKEFDWTSPSVPPGETEHYCLQVVITHPDDVNATNNEGWNNTLVHRAAAGETFRLIVPVWNRFGRKPMGGTRRADSGDRREDRFSRIALSLDSYQIDTAAAAAGDLDALFARRESLWGATVNPAELVLPPGARQPGEVEFTVTVPPGAAPGTRAGFNLSATAAGWPLGGVTVYIEVG